MGEVLRKEPAFRIGVIGGVKAPLCFGRGGFLPAEAAIALLAGGSQQQQCTRVWMCVVGEVWVL